LLKHCTRHAVIHDNRSFNRRVTHPLLLLFAVDMWMLLPPLGSMGQAGRLCSRQEQIDDLSDTEAFVNISPDEFQIEDSWRTLGTPLMETIQHQILHS